MRGDHLRRHLIALPLEVVALDTDGMARLDQALADRDVIDEVLGERDPRRVHKRQGTYRRQLLVGEIGQLAPCAFAAALRGVGVAQVGPRFDGLSSCAKAPASPT